MEIIYQLVRKLILVAIFAAFCELLLPRSKFQPYMRMVVGLIVIAMLLQPVLELRGAAFNWQGLLDVWGDSPGEIDSSWLPEQTQAMVEEQLADQAKEFLAQEYADHQVEVSLDLDFDEQGMLTAFNGMEVVIVEEQSATSTVQPINIGAATQSLVPGPPHIVSALASHLELDTGKIELWIEAGGGNDSDN